jgi:uncharacterized pyridoxamine 5'-phosphate oxidase family protein
MEFKDCVKFANDVHTCYLATVEGDQPRVRPMGMYFADNTGFYFHTESTKSLAKQLEANDKVELVFYAPPKVLRVSGRIQFLDDLALKAKILNDRPFLRNLGITKPEDPLMVAFKVYTGEAFFWTMADNMKEAEIKRINF